MTNTNLHHKRDFSLIIESEAGFTAPFALRFFTSRPISAYTVGRDFDGNLYGCTVLSDGRLLVPFNNFCQTNRQGFGFLMVEPTTMIPNSVYPDGYENQVLPARKVEAAIASSDEDSDETESTTIFIGLKDDTDGVDFNVSLPINWQTGATGATGKTGPQGPAGKDADIAGANAAIASANSAASSANSAATTANNAATSAQNAATSATNAASQANTARDGANAAKDAANSAAASANSAASAASQVSGQVQDLASQLSQQATSMQTQVNTAINGIPTEINSQMSAIRSDLVGINTILESI